MQFRVPQFIDTEDKVIGPFSLRQFGYIAGAGVGSFLLYITVQTWLWFILSIMLGGAGLALAFLKINGQPLPRLLRAGLMFYWHPQVYLWQTGHAGDQESVHTERFSLERVVSGLALKRAWRYLQTGGAPKEEKLAAPKRHGTDRYQVFHRATGEQHIAKRIDYT